MHLCKSKCAIAAAAFIAILALAPNNAHAQVPATPTIPGASPNSVPVWALMGCSAGIIFAGFVANARDDRQLTAGEAWLCGIPFWFEQPVEKKKKHHWRRRSH